MRFYKNFSDAQNEIKRDLAELGVNVHTETMQAIYIADRPEFETKELVNYIYTVTDPDFSMIDGVHEEWLKQEWEDRISGGLNPGFAWKKRREIWEPLMYEKDKVVDTGKFDYTYSQRMGGTHILSVIDELKEHPHSRQLFIPVWDRQLDESRRGKRRVPCSLGYWLVQRGGELHMTYMMRSCDFVTHFGNDVALASILLHYIAKQTNFAVGHFTHFVGSLHAYRKDLADVF
jgi:thymidylate synthase